MWRLGAVGMLGALLVTGQGAARAEEAGSIEIVVEPTAETGDDAESPGKKSKAKATKKSDGAPVANTAEHLQATFTEFCSGWLEKLRERERHNLGKVKWETDASGSVVAEYVGYDTKNPGPQTVGNVDTTPIGKMVYMEFRLRRSGASKEEAMTREPEIVDRVEVTEIFRHDRSGWVY